MSAGSGSPAASELSSVGLLELLKEDPRPSCVVDLENVLDGECVPQICFRNARFTYDYDFEAPVLGSDTTEDERLYFRSWGLSRITQDSRSSINCHGLTWVAVTIQKRWKVIQGTTSNNLAEDSDSDASHHDLKHAGVLKNLPKGSAEAHHEWLRGMMQKASPHDWTAAIRPRKLSDHVLFLRSWDWASTPLGPIDTWSPRLRLMVNLITVDPNPAVLFWGDKLVGIYNEAYVPVLHDKHPKALGEPYHKTWSELYRQEEVAKLLDDLWKKNLKGEPIMWVHRTFYLRNGHRLQEHIFNMSFLPIIDEEGKTVGFYEPIKEVTRDALAERRSDTIRCISTLVAGEDDIGAFYQKVIAALESNPNDIPFAMLYSLKPSNIDWKKPFRLDCALQTGLAKLESYLGVRTAANGEPLVHDLLMKDKAFLDVFEEICRGGYIETFDLESRSIIQESITEEKPTRGFGDHTRLAALLPIESIAGKGVNAVLFVGTNTRRPYDADFEAFMRDLGRSVSSMLAALILNNDQKKRVGEALQSEKRAVSMLEASPVGSCLLDREGRILYTNTSWQTITGYTHNDEAMSWLEMMLGDSGNKARRAFTNIVERGQEVTLELALKKPWHYTDPMTGEQVQDITYILVSALLQRLGDEDYVISVVTDISYQKWMEGLHDKRRREALEMKRAQENFMDMTSHEMRNPLSAIFQCADAIVSSLSALSGIAGMPELSTVDARNSPDTSRKSSLVGVDPAIAEAIQHAIENAGTITLCAQHQRRIVDDVLVLSKVDARLIEIHPVEVQPRTLIENAIKMFAAELNANKAKMTLEVEPSFNDLKVEWVKLDPGRLLQVLINLCTNAIKFTMDSYIKKITIRIGASATIPTHSSQGVRYLHGVNDDEGFEDPTSLPEWGDGEELYLSFQVTDTGQGMTPDEMKLLFQRFKQASPRTHTQYGGSGLGLFIARLLSRLQGGEIGVTSKAGKGTSFAFYVKVRRIPTPHGAGLHEIVPELNLPVGSHNPDSPSILTDETTKPKDPSEITILVVEDNLVNQRVLGQQLKAQDFKVFIANNGAEALSLVKRSEHWDGEAGPPLSPTKITYDTTNGPLKLSVILMDVEMPIMNGVEATKRIRDYEKSGAILSHIPIVAITANARIEQIAVAKDSGMDDVVSKPFRIPELLGKLEVFLGPIKRKEVGKK